MSPVHLLASDAYLATRPEDGLINSACRIAVWTNASQQTLLRSRRRDQSASA